MTAVTRWLGTVSVCGFACACESSGGSGLESRELRASDQRAVTAVILKDFLRRNAPANWPVIFISDEHVGFSVDSSFLQSLSQTDVPIQVARRADVWVSFDIVRDGGLLLEPNRPEGIDGRSVVQRLRFSSSAYFGGEFEYRLRRVSGQWVIEEKFVIWIV